MWSQTKYDPKKYPQMLTQIQTQMILFMMMFHLFTMHLVSAMHLCIFFTTFHQLLKLLDLSHFLKIDLCIADSDGLADTDREDNAHHSFFSSKLVAEDQGHSEGMLIVKVILSGVDRVTYIMLSVSLE